MRIVPYKLGSKSAKALAKELGTKLARPNGNFRNNYDHVIIGWGNSVPFRFPTRNGVLNDPYAVQFSACKLQTLRVLSAAYVPTLHYTVSPTEAEQLLEEGNVIFARHRLNGRSGQGIQVIQPGDSLPYAPLYTVFFDKVTEYRVHATHTDVFDFQAKLKRQGQDADRYVHNYDNGRVFCRNNIELPDSAAEASVAAVNALGLDFGAVDVGVDSEGNAAVFEVNSAPSLQGKTLKSYTRMIRSLL